MPTAAIIALCSLGFAVLLQTAFGGYFIGRLTQRVKTLEDDGSGHSGLAVQFAEFQGRMTALMQAHSTAMEGLRKDLTWLRKAAVYEPEQMRGGRLP